LSLTKRNFLFTSESVTEGHPDKVADVISDSVLDAVLAQDPRGRVACETLVTTGLAILAGEITTTAHVEYADGRKARVPVVAPLKIAIDGRVAVSDAVRAPARTEPLLGLLALEALDLVPDPTTRRLKPKHPGKWPRMMLK